MVVGVLQAQKICVHCNNWDKPEGAPHLCGERPNSLYNYTYVYTYVYLIRHIEM